MVVQISLYRCVMLTVIPVRLPTMSHFQRRLDQRSDDRLGRAPREWDLESDLSLYSRQSIMKSEKTADDISHATATTTSSAATPSSWGTPISQEESKRLRLLSAPSHSQVDIPINECIETDAISALSQSQATASRPKRQPIDQNYFIDHLTVKPVQTQNGSFPGSIGRSVGQPVQQYQQQQQPQPYLPHKTSEVPKSALHAIYGKPPRRHTISSGDYFTWHDSGPPHALQWSSCFLCPLTAELFLSKPFRGTDGHTGKFVPSGCGSEPLWYFPKKISAEHGAAACAYDCWAYRDLALVVAAQQQIQLEPKAMLMMDEFQPYLQSLYGDEIPISIPTQTRIKIEEQRQVILARNANRMDAS